MGEGQLRSPMIQMSSEGRLCLQHCPDIVDFSEIWLTVASEIYFECPKPMLLHFDLFFALFSILHFLILYVLLWNFAT
jgi:hypothetical protein